jgi:hypothetical protein
MRMREINSFVFRLLLLNWGIFGGPAERFIEDYLDVLTK